MRSRTFQLIALALMSFLANAQTPPGDEANNQRRVLINQKLRLVESLINAPAERARTALAANRLDEASQALDEALRSTIKAANRPGNKHEAQGSNALQAAFPGLAEQVATYRVPLEDLARQGSGEALAAVSRISGLQADANRLADTGRWNEATRKLTEAYRFSIESLSKLRAGQTVTLSLAFNTPRDEYNYENNRFQSATLLVNMMIDDGRAAGERRKLVDDFVREAKQWRSAAADLARDDNYKAAVASMEKAIALMNRGLQAMGVPVF